MKLSRRSLLLNLLAARRPPNVVLILADDLGWADLGCYGNTYHETPHLDRLAAEGIRFSNAYAACAVCSPSRAALLTGRSPARLGMTTYLQPHPKPGEPVEGYQPSSTRKLLEPLNRNWLELGETTIAESLKAAGYACGSIGKWHLGPAGYFPEDQGFDINLASSHAGAPPTYFDPYKGQLNLPSRRRGEYLTTRLADEAARFVRRHRHEPFFLYLPHYAVHAPLEAEDPLIRKYSRKTPGTRHRNPTYAAMVESLDNAAGRVLAELGAHGLSNDTLVIFTSDNGGVDADANGHPRDYYTSNYPLRAGKCWPYEGGIRVPAIVRWPGHTTAGSVSHEPVTGVDWMPTICEAAGVPLPRDRAVDGVSLAPLLAGHPARPHGPLYWHFPHYQHTTPYSAIREGDWKLIRFYESSKQELYHLARDIGETHDVAAQYPEHLQALAAKLDRWLRETGARLPVRNPAYSG